MLNYNKVTSNLASNLVYSFKEVWSFKKHYVIIIMILIILQVLGKAISTYTPPIIINVVENQLRLNIVLLIVFSLIVLNCVHLCIDAVFQHKIWTEYQTKYVYYIKNKIMLACMSMSYSQLENPEMTTLKEKAERANYSCYSMLTTIYIIFSNLLVFMIFGGILATLHPLLLVLLIITAMIYFHFMKYSRNYQHKMKDKNAVIDRKLEYIKTISTDFSYAKEVRLYRMQSWIKSLTKLFFKEHYEIYKTMQKKVFYIDVAHSALTLLRDGVAYIYLVYNTVAGNISVDRFVLYFATIVTVADTINNFVVYFNRLKVESLLVNDLRDFLSITGRDMHEQKVPENRVEDGICIELKNLSFKYPGAKHNTLNQINLRIEKKQKVALVGPNGAGKTTLVKLICGMYEPTEGEILINGKPLPYKSLNAYYKQVSAVFQSTSFLPITIGENIGIVDAKLYDRDKICECLILAGIWDKIKTLPNGIDTNMSKDMYEDAVSFSGGEMQKFMLARAIYKDSSLLVLDEPTAALDPIAENEIYQKYSTIAEDKTSVFISHRLSSTRFCDNIVLIMDGEIKEMGSHEDLLVQKGEYAEIFAKQSYYYQNNINKTSRWEFAHAEEIINE